MIINHRMKKRIKILIEMTLYSTKNVSSLFTVLMQHLKFSFGIQTSKIKVNLITLIFF